jgi:hypothetical protein
MDDPEISLPPAGADMPVKGSFAPEADPRFEMVGFSRTDDLKSRDERKYRLLQTSMDLRAAINRYA